MSTKYTKSLSIWLAEQMIESVSEPSSSNIYVSVGKVDPWANDASPDVPVDSVGEKYDVWKDLWFLKKVTGNDMCLCAPRVNWEQDTVYTAYTEQNENLYGNNFYVLTSAHNVYKCLDNNRSAMSTVEPSFTSPSIVNRTSDGYVWKYMFTVRRSDRVRFMSHDWLPVRRLTLDDGTLQWRVQNSAVSGAITAIRVQDGGENFWANVRANVTITGDGTLATANVVKDPSTNTVKYIIVSNDGQDYTRATITVTANNSHAINVVANAVISPFGGQGSDPVVELGASTVMINIRLKGNENEEVQTGNEFRQVAIIRDPHIATTGNSSANTIVSQTLDLSLSGFSNPYILDEWVYQGASFAAATFKGKVVYFDVNSNFLQLSKVEGTVTTASLIGNDSAATRFVTDITNPELERFSGDVLYIDNVIPVIRNDDQTDDIRIPIRF